MNYCVNCGVPSDHGFDTCVLCNEPLRKVAAKQTVCFIRADKVFGESAKGYVVGFFQPVELAHNIHAAKYQKKRLLQDSGLPDLFVDGQADTPSQNVQG